MRSLRIGSRPFQSASARHRRCSMSREAGEAVLAPAVGPRAGMVVRQVLPRRAVRAVVLAHGPPLALAEVRAPVVPVARLAQPVLEAAEALDPLALDAHSRSRRRRSRRLRSRLSSSAYAHAVGLVPSAILRG